MLLNDKEILSLAKQGMITPFEQSLIRQVKDKKVISYGLSSYGYDIRLSPKEFKVFHRQPYQVVDPKRFDARCLLNSTRYGSGVTDSKLYNEQYFILPAHSYGLGVALEHLSIPNDISVICLGKSTYARAGIIANITPGEAGWKGYLTLEFSNSSDADCRIYANEGIVQLLFFRGKPCKTSYEDRKGKYQQQPERVVPPLV